MMNVDWRFHAKSNEWHKIDICDVPVCDYPELLISLKAFVPKRWFGHGIETYEDFITPEEATDSIIHNAAFMLRYIRIEAEGMMRNIQFNFFEQAERIAIRTLSEQFGVEYEGCGYTYLYKRRDDSWRQLPSRIGMAIEKRRDEKRSVMGDREFVEWVSLYPWRSAGTLLQLMCLDSVFIPNSPVDHAVNLLSIMEPYQDSMSNLQGGRGQVEMETQRLANASFYIGRHYEALIRKPYEEYAVRKLEEVKRNRENGMNGGQAGKKAERYRVLNDLAMHKREKFAFASEKENIRTAKGLAAAYDKGAETPLFMERRKPLSTGWYGEWLSQFLMVVRRRQ